MALRNLHRVKEKYRCQDNIIINNIEKEKIYIIWTNSRDLNTSINFLYSRVLQKLFNVKTT